MVAARAEYVIQENIINIVPSFHNYQDIRTLVTVTTTSLFRSVVICGNITYR